MNEDSHAALKLPSHFPPVLYLPVVEHVTDANDARLWMHRTKDGRMAMLAYTALDRLYLACGDDQPWVLMPLETLEAIHASQPYELLLMDMVVPIEYRWNANNAATADTSSR